MQRQRGELVPIGEVVSGLDDALVPAIRDATPQSLHHFSQADQVNLLVGASEADPDLGFMARMMALCALPRTNPGNRLQYKRVNGPFTLYMNTTADNKLPYGNLPRLLMAWLSTEAVKTGSRVIVLGDSLSKFMRELGYLQQRREATNPPPQPNEAAVRLHRLDDLQRRAREQFISSLIAESGEFWWNERKPDQPSLWNSKIELSEKFFNEIIRHPVPLDINTLTALKRCSLGLDLYLWLAYRTFPLRAVQQITWKQMYRQFGLHPSKASDKKTVLNFRVKILRELKKIKLAWPELNYSTAPGVLILLPSVPTIPPVESSPRLAR